MTEATPLTEADHKYLAQAEKAADKATARAAAVLEGLQAKAGSALSRQETLFLTQPMLYDMDASGPINKLRKTIYIPRELLTRDLT